MAIKTTVPRATIASSRWNRLKDIVDEALAQDTREARASVVRSRCADDAVLLREAESLLAEAALLENEPTDWMEDCAEQATRTFWADELSREGERIGAYVVVRELGRGGMGAVYLAARADGQFEKQVAIKVLKRGTDTEEVLQRFAIERRIVARLDHPNIAHLLDAGTTEDGLPYFVMEYVDGVPVTQFAREQQLSLAARLQLFLKVCAAVEVAHRAAVVHRDLKPRNILVTAGAEPKLLDFGIAKLLEPGDAALDVTAAGRQHLTPSSAAPEQVRGEGVTAASDVYALGALLYELVAARGPYRFSNAQPPREEVVRVVCEQEPPLPSAVAADPETQRALRGDLDAIVLRAMRKDPAQRYRSAAELAADVERYLNGRAIAHAPTTARDGKPRLVPWPRVTAAAAVLAGIAVAAAILIPRVARESSPAAVTDERPRSDAPKSIAVLPFENLSAEPENAFFATGVQDAILTDLAKVADLKVLSRASVQQYADSRSRDLREISQLLDVAHVLEGGVQRDGTRVRVTARLVDARTGEQKWAENYDRELADVFSIQSQIAQTIVARLEAKLLPREKAAIEVPPTRDPIAYDLYLRAREMVDGYLNAPDAKASLEQVIGLLEEATRRDPQFAVAWSYAARAHSIIWGLGLDPERMHARQAEAALERAFALDPDLPEAHFAKAENFYRSGRLEQAEREIALALPRMPNSAPLHTLAGNVWRRQARWHEAELSLIKAVELDPKNANAVTFLADTQVLMRRYSEAIATYERARAMGFDPVLIAVRVGVIEFQATGRSERLRAALARAPADLDNSGGETPWRIMFALMDGDYDRAAAALASSPRSTFQDVDQSFHYPRSWYEGVIARAAGRSDEARAAFRQTLADLGADEKNRPISFRGLTVIAQARAAVGEKESAIECAERAAQTIGVGSNAYDQPLIQQGLAQVYTWTGEHDRALELVEGLVKLPGYLSYGHLLHDPAWEPLRGNPRFQALTASLAPDAKAQAFSPAREEVMVEKSIAVLPFENLSVEPQNAFLAVGVQDAIVTDLGKVADLKVLSRASVEQYSDTKSRDLRAIGRALNVAHVIEGAVQSAGDRVRVTARLIDARTGEQKWAQQYDRELADVFSMQSQIAQTIVAQLQAKLLPREKAAIEVPPTRDPVAYDLYLRAREMVDSYTNTPDPKTSLEQAIGLLTEATQRDPQFAVAWSYAARASMIITALGLAPDGVHARAAEAALERAVVLNPELPEVHFAKAELFYRNGGRYEQAEREIALALPGMPNSAPLHTLAGNVWRRQGRWHEAEQILIKAVELDPKNGNAISFLADTQILMRRYTEAIATYERARAMGFDPVLFAVRVGIIEFLATGQSEPLRLALLRGPADLDIQGGDTPWRIMFALMDRDYDRAAAELARSPRARFQDVDLSFYYPRAWYEGVIARAAGRSDEARDAFRRVLVDLRGDEENRRTTRALAVIAQARAGAGETERAIQLAERAAQTVGPGSNAYDQPLVQQGLAQVYTWTGQHDRALEIIERLVKLPGYLSYGHLLHDPAWEPLRGYPRFQAIVASIAPR